MATLISVSDARDRITDAIGDMVVEQEAKIEAIQRQINILNGYIAGLDKPGIDHVQRMASIYLGDDFEVVEDGPDDEETKAFKESLPSGETLRGTFTAVVPDDEEHELAVALDAYTDPTAPEYDPAFTRTIKALRPDWFPETK